MGFPSKLFPTCGIKSINYHRAQVECIEACTVSNQYPASASLCAYALKAVLQPSLLLLKLLFCSQVLLLQY